MCRELRKLNLGCGGQTPAQWINVDYSLGSRLSKIPFFSLLSRNLNIFDTDWNDDIVSHDLRKKFPWKDQQIDVIYSSHTLEHLSRTEGLHFLKECHRVLKKNGIIRIVVPDLRVLVDDYNRGITSADHFVESLGVLKESGVKGLLAPLNHVPHKCMYDTESLLHLMRDIGFICEERQSFSSRIVDIEQVELQHRIEDAVIVEGQKA